jgi:ABC-type transport system involved in multi-copper enzyme maturation permease subunit
MESVKVSVEDMKCFWKANFSWDCLVPIGVFGVLVVFVLQYSSRMHEAKKVLTVFTLYEVFMPLLFSILVASLIPLEVEQGTLDLLMTYPKPRWITLLYKLSLPVCFMLAIFLFTILVNSIYVTIDLWFIVKVSLLPILFLGFTTLLVSMLSKSYISACDVSSMYNLSYNL